MLNYVFCSYGMDVDATSLYDDTLLRRACADRLLHDDNLLSFDGRCFCCVRCSLHIEVESSLDRNSEVPDRPDTPVTPNFLTQLTEVTFHFKTWSHSVFSTSDDSDLKK